MKQCQRILICNARESIKKLIYLGLVVSASLYAETIFALKVNLFACSSDGLPFISKVVDVSDPSSFSSAKPLSQKEIVFTIKHRFSGDKLHIYWVGADPIDKKTNKTLHKPDHLPAIVCQHEYNNDLENCIAVKDFRDKCNHGDILAVFASKMFTDEVLEETLRKAHIENTASDGKELRN